MSKVILSVPSKTFLAGEYLALLGGSSLVVNTSPRFILEVSSSTEPFVNPFHPSSLAGILVEQNLDQLSGKKFLFFDPHYGRGGWGRSSAEFALVYSYLNLGSVKQMVKDYQFLAKRYTEQSPSGYDVAAQVMGRVAFVYKSLEQYSSYFWQYSDLGFFLVSTGHKLATHEHLRNLNLSQIGELTNPVERVVEAFKNSSSQYFVNELNQLAKTLNQLGFVAESTQNLLKEISHPSILAKKGCGALGADVLLLVYQKSGLNKLEVLKELTALDLKVVASDEALDQGLMIYKQEVVHEVHI